MSRTSTILREEWRLQSRSLRFRYAVAVYWLISAIPPVALYLMAKDSTDQLFGAGAYFSHTLVVQGALTPFLALLVAGARSGREALEEQWVPLASAGLSSTGFLMRRFLALVVVIVPVLIVPALVAVAVALYADPGPVSWGDWLAQWTIQILPRALVVTAAWLALVTILGGELLAMVFGVLGIQLVSGSLNYVLLRYQLTLGDPLEWLGLNDARYWLRSLTINRDPERRYSMPLAVTEAPYDFLGAWEWLWPRAALSVGLTFFLLTLAGLFLGRTRRDLRPWQVSEKHSLRTFVPFLNTLRSRHAPDAGSGWRERLFALGGFVVCGLVMGALADRLWTFHTLAESRYHASRELAYEPLPPTVVPGEWAVRGRLDRRAIELEVEGTMKNQGEDAVPALVFTLNPGLELAETVAEGHRVSVDHRWDRLRLELDPPLAAGASVKLRWRLSGQPMDPYFGMYSVRGAVSFVEGYGRHRSGRFARQLEDLTRSKRRPNISRRRVGLEPGDLGPVPRYSTWQLTPPKASPGEFGEQVPEEIFHRSADLTLELETPSEWMLMDSCGGVSEITDSGARLQSACSMALSELVVRGGELVRVEGGSGLVELLVQPEHMERGEGMLRSLDAAARLSDRAWPGSEGLRRLVVHEWPPEFYILLTGGLGNFWYEGLEGQLSGRLLSLPEGQIIRPRPVSGERIIVQALSRELLQRRRFAPDEEHIFVRIFQSLMLRRMGLSEKGATVSGRPWVRASLGRSILDAEPNNRLVLELRLYGVLVDLEGRIGARSLFLGIEQFLNRPGEAHGTMRELFDDLEAVSGKDLSRFFDEFVDGGAVPQLTLEEVSARRLEGRRFLVQGQVVNKGVGEVHCPLVVKTELGENQILVTTRDEATTDFELTVEHRPVSVLLDPQDTCFRWVESKKRETMERFYFEDIPL